MENCFYFNCRKIYQVVFIIIEIFDEQELIKLAIGKFVRFCCIRKMNLLQPSVLFINVYGFPLFKVKQGLYD